MNNLKKNEKNIAKNLNKLPDYDLVVQSEQASLHINIDNDELFIPTGFDGQVYIYFLNNILDFDPTVFEYCGPVKGESFQIYECDSSNATIALEINRRFNYDIFRLEECIIFLNVE